MNTKINKSSKIFVAGHNGLVGSAVVECFKSKGFENILTRTRQQLDLTNTAAVNEFFNSEKPDGVIIAAAKVGGILANNTYRADFIYDNLQIQNNLIWASHLNNVNRVIFLGSSCIYPRDAEQPMSESALLTGNLEYTNRPYAIAKIAGLELIDSLRKQYGRDYFSVMPTNLYGPRDNFHPENSNVLPALLRKFVEATKNGDKVVSVWGSGNPKREFMYSYDCANAIVHLFTNLTQGDLENSPIGKANWSHINIGTGSDISIKEVAQIIAQATGFKGDIQFDATKPDGTPRKLLDVSLLKSFGWESSVKLEDGIRKTLDWYEDNK